MGGGATQPEIGITDAPGQNWVEAHGHARVFLPAGLVVIRLCDEYEGLDTHEHLQER